MGSGRVLLIGSNARVTLTDLTITGGNTPTSVGGGILNEVSTLILSGSSVVSGNTADEV